MSEEIITLKTITQSLESENGEKGEQLREMQKLRLRIGDLETELSGAAEVAAQVPDL